MRMLREDRKHTNVGGWAAVLQVAEALRGDVTGNTDGRATVGNARAEAADVAGLMAAGETEVVVLAVHSDVLVVPLRELLDGSLNSLHAAGLTHLLCRVVGVAASTIPVALERLGVEGNLDAPLLGYTNEKVTRHPKVIAHGDTLAWSDLELPLRGHDLGVDAGNIDTRVEAGAVVSLNQVTSEHLPGT